MASGEGVVYLNLEASTWRPRGRISFGIEPTIRLKLASAGLRLTDDPAAPHDATLTINYTEKRGKQISVNLFGTDIMCSVLLDDPQNEHTLSLIINEPHPTPIS